MRQISHVWTNAIRATVALGAVAIISAQANAVSTIGYWNLDTIPSVSAAPVGINSIPTAIGADVGSGTLYLTDHNGTAGTGFKGNVDDATGTVVNTGTNFIGTNVGLAFTNGITGNALAGNNSFIDMSFPLSGSSNIGVSYATYASSAPAFNSNQWSYSTDGINYTDFGGAVTQSSLPGSNHITVGANNLVGPLVTPVDTFTGTGYLRYTFSGATGTSGAPLNRFDNLLIQSDASSPAAPNAASLPQAGDIAFGLNNADPNNTLEFVRGSTAPSGGVRYPAPNYQYTTPTVATPAPLPFMESMKFDNYGSTLHNANGNLLGVDFGTTATGGEIYSLATTGTTSSPAAQLIGNTKLAANGNFGQSGAGTCGAGPCLTGVTLSRLAGLSVSPSNNKLAVVGTDTGRVLVYDYTPGNTAGAGAAAANGRESVVNVSAATQGTVWKDNNTVIAFNAPGNLVTVDATTMVTTDVGVAGGSGLVSAGDVTTPLLGSNYTSLAYNPSVSPYLYALYSGFAGPASPPSQTRLYVFDDPTGVRPGSTPYALLTTQVTALLKGVDLSLSTQTGRDIALDKDGNLLIGAFDSTITYLPAADFATPASIAAIANNSSTFYYGSTYNATAFSGMDIGFAAATLAGDFNLDGKVDAADYVSWRKGNSPNPNSLADYNTWRANFGAGPGAGAGLGTSTVPEPASAGLFLLGLVALCWRRRGA